MLNDLSTFTRVSTFFQVLPVGVLIGGSILAPAAGLGAFLLTVGAMLVLMFGWCIAAVVATRVMVSRFHGDIARGSAEIVQQGLPATIAPARLVRSRSRNSMRPWALGPAPRAPGRTWSVTFTVLPHDGPARRVGALVPIKLNKGAPALLALHPHRPEVGVIDLRATRDQIAAVQQDLRWATEDLPSDGTVVGGYLWLVVVGLGALGTGLAVGIAMMLALS